ncbi:hypothetical protein CK203_024140 [Vitis vinifera]|uniref:Uncharacterized protein n=1 Tax=Vitis vinifera TaxID=29760 RepID=A0A438I4V5_VITVI|nr:hypothetical protein CK203_024140 [Vitis vinifera]
MDRITSSTTLKDEITVEIIDITLLNPAITQDQLRYLLPMIYLVRFEMNPDLEKYPYKAIDYGNNFLCFLLSYKGKTGLILSSLINAAVNDEVLQLDQLVVVHWCHHMLSANFQRDLQKFIHAVESNTRDPLVLVRITASWALANICDSLRHCISDFSSERHSVASNLWDTVDNATLGNPFEHRQAGYNLDLISTWKPP